MGQDEDAAGARGLDEAERGDRLAGAGGVLEPEALAGVRVLRRLAELLVVLAGGRLVPVLRLVGLVLVVELLLARDPDRREHHLGLRRRRRSRCRCRCAGPRRSSAVSVPESASTWWAERTAPSASCGSSSLSSRSRPSSRENVRRHATDGTLAPASISAIAASNARRCGVPGASTVAASSPSERNGSRVNFEARSMSLDDGSVAGVATGVVSAMKGDDSVKTAVYSARSRALRGSLGSEGPALPAGSQKRVVPARRLLLQQVRRDLPV